MIKNNLEVEKKIKLTEYTLKGVGQLILTKRVLDQIDYLHKKIGNIEWSGVLFFKELEGDISEPQTVVLQAEYIYLLDIGTAAYTENVFTAEQIMEMFETVPDAENMLRAGIHTHHNMATFFSATDMEELHDNSGKYEYYLSLIVNNAGSYSAKVAFVGEVERTFKYKNNSKGKFKPVVTTNEALVMFDMNIIKEERVLVDSDFEAIYNKVYAENEKKKLSKFSTTNFYGKGSKVGYNFDPYDTYGTFNNYNNRFQSNESKKYHKQESNNKYTQKELFSDNKSFNKKKVNSPNVRKEFTEWLRDCADICPDVFPDNKIPGSFHNILDKYNAFFANKENDWLIDDFLNNATLRIKNNFKSLENDEISYFGCELFEKHADAYKISEDFFDIFNTYEDFLELENNIK